MAMEYSFDKNQRHKMWSDENNCLMCGSNKQLELHHITHKRNNAKSIFNGILLCHNCHMKYGSSSASDVIKHLNIAGRFLLYKHNKLKRDDLVYENIFNETDKKFLEEFEVKYQKELFKELWKTIK